MLLAILAVMTLAAMALALAPLIRRPRPAAEAEAGAADLHIYRDQLAEIEADRVRGLIAPGEAAGARREIERRLLRAFDAARDAAAGRAAAGAEPQPARRRRLIAALALALGIPAIAGLIYARLGAAGDIGALPWEPSLEQRQVAEFERLLHQLEAKVRAEPNRAEGWALLGRMYAAEHRFAEAANAFHRASALRPADAELYVAEGEARVLAAGGTVTAEARGLLDQALARDPRNPGARFYKGLGLWQAGEKRAAYETWRALADEAPADAPWLPEVRARLRDMAASLGIAEPAPAPRTAPGPSAEDMARAAAMTPEQRAAMIRSMVDSLAARLKQQPDDLAGWMRLGRAYAVLREPDKAVAAFEQARRLAPDDPDVLVGLGQARGEAGDAAGAQAALEAARDRLPAGDPRRDQVEQTMRSLAPAGGAARPTPLR